MSVPAASPLLPSTTEQVPQQTDPAINEQITQQTEANVEAYSADRRLIDVRLEELDGKWDIEADSRSQRRGRLFDRIDACTL